MTPTQSYSASCPACGYEHDFTSKREMESAWARWQSAMRKAVGRMGGKRA